MSSVPGLLHRKNSRVSVRSLHPQSKHRTKCVPFGHSACGSVARLWPTQRPRPPHTSFTPRPAASRTALLAWTAARRRVRSDPPPTTTKPSSPASETRSLQGTVRAAARTPTPPCSPLCWARASRSPTSGKAGRPCRYPPPTPPPLTPPQRRHQLDPHSPLCRYPPHTPPSSHTPPPHSTSTPHPLSTHSPQTWADAPYWIRPGFRALTAAKWDVIILMLGTNDATQHGQKCPLGCDPARLLRLRGTRLAALGSPALPGRGRLTGRPATASGARASHLQDP